MQGQSTDDRFFLEASDNSVDIDDFVRKGNDEPGARLNAGVDTFSKQFKNEKNSLRIKRDIFGPKGVQFSQERLSIKMMDKIKDKKPGVSTRSIKTLLDISRSSTLMDKGRS